MRFRAPQAPPQGPSQTAPARQGDALATLGDPAVTALIDAMADGIVVTDAAGRIRAMNTAAEALNRVERADHAGAPISELADASEVELTEIVDAFHGGKKAEVLTRGADAAPQLTSLRFLRGPAGEVLGAIVVQRDLRQADYLRRSAESSTRGEVFKFAAERAIHPDFEAQRRLSPRLDRILKSGERALRQGAGLLLTGESGSGKTEIARQLHATVAGAGEPFVQVNCASIPETLFESEMFGYERGAFTGALRSGKRGLIEMAEGGCLFLDEVGEIPPLSQAKLLKFLEDGAVQRVGGAAPRRIRTRVIAASNRDLLGMVADGRFRRDLYYRLAVVPLHVPPLRSEPALRDHLIDHFLDKVVQARGAPLTLGADCRAALRDYGYPGNVRELHNILQQVSVLAEEAAGRDDLPPHVAPRVGDETAGAPSLKDQVRAFETTIIRDAIGRHGSKRKAAKALGVDIGTIVRKTQTGPAADPVDQHRVLLGDPQTGRGK